MVRQRGGVREPRGASREQEDFGKSRLPRVRPVFLILGFLSLVIVITVFLSTRPKAANRLTAGYVGRFNAITCAFFYLCDSTSETLQKKNLDQ